MAADIQKLDLVDIELNNGNVHRNWMEHSIGLTDVKANAFGVRVFRDGEPVTLTTISVQGYFRDPQGNNIAITSGNTVSGNVAYVVLPAACYNYEGQFVLAIKLVGGGITGTVRIVDGMVDNTHTGGAITPAPSVATYDEVLAGFTQAMAVIEASVRYDITQSKTATEKQTARENIQAASRMIIAPEFAKATANDAGSLVTKDGLLYYLPNGHTANTEWADTTKTSVKIDDRLKSLSGDITTEAVNRAAGDASNLLQIAPVFAEATAYDAGQLVTNSGILYILPNGHTANTTWANTTKTAVNVASQLSELKSAIKDKDDEINCLHGLVNYGYDTPGELEENPSSESATCIGVKRAYEFVTLNGTNRSGTSIRIRLNGTIARTMSSDTVDSWNTNLFTPQSGKRYKLTAKLVSGSMSGGHVSISVYKTGYHNTVATEIALDDGYTGTFTADGSSYNICLFVRNGYAFTNARYMISVTDITNIDIQEDYEILDYLQSTGSQYLSTGVKLNQDSRVKIAFQFTGLPTGTSWGYVFGGRQSTTSKAFGIGVNADGIIKPGYATYANQIPNYIGTDVHVVDFNKNNLTLDGELVFTGESATFETPVRAELFASSGESTSNHYYGKVRIFYCQIYDANGDLVRDFIPVKQKSNSVTGMYDFVTKTLFTPNSALTEGNELSIESVFQKTLDIDGSIFNLKKNIQDIGNQTTGKAYVQTEGDRVAEKVRNVQTGNSITFVAVSDMHYSVDSATVIEALKDMRDGVKVIAEQVDIDFYASFGDIIYRLSTNGDFSKGKNEAIGATKLLSEAFRDNPQIRIVGNHDPNAEGSTGYFTPNQLNAFCGIYSDMLNRNESMPNQGIGYCDLERQKVRIVVLNTSYYSSTPDQSATQYSFGDAQGYWLCQAIDLSEKSDAGEWQIVIFSHVVLDSEYHGGISPYSYILAAYEGGTTWTKGSYSYDFSGKNAAKLSLYMNGHKHAYYFKNMRKVDSTGSILATLKMANIFVPNALPGREEESIDGVTYTKTADSATSTAFQIVTIDFVNGILWAYHYGAGIDVIMHYVPQSVTGSTSLTTSLTSPSWNSQNISVATVSSGTVTPVADGNTMIWAKSTTDNCIEVWNISVDV